MLDDKSPLKGKDLILDYAKGIAQLVRFLGWPH